MIVASILAGRIRVRDEGLKKAVLASGVTEALEGTPGVSAAEVNPRVGSLLVRYDAALVTAERIVETVAGLLGVEAPQSAPSPEAPPVREPLFGRPCSLSLSLPPAARRRIVNLGMLASLALSVAAAVFDFKKLHILAGILFLALFGDHFYQKRETMFA